jgi:hypothetical protein
MARPLVVTVTVDEPHEIKALGVRVTLRHLKRGRYRLFVERLADARDELYVPPKCESSDKFN